MDEFKQIVMSCSEQGKALAQRMAARGVFETLHLYYKASQPGKSGSLHLACDNAPAPLGAQLASTECLGGGVPYSAYFQWVYERSRHLPVLSC